MENLAQWERTSMSKIVIGLSERPRRRRHDTRRSFILSADDIERPPVPVASTADLDAVALAIGQPTTAEMLAILTGGYSLMVEMMRRKRLKCAECRKQFAKGDRPPFVAFRIPVSGLPPSIAPMCAACGSPLFRRH
jgi:hypothetical protein